MIRIFTQNLKPPNLNQTLIVQENHHIRVVKNTRNSFFTKFADIGTRKIFNLYSSKRERKS